jgi:hypothetical protein
MQRLVDDAVVPAEGLLDRLDGPGAVDGALVLGDVVVDLAKGDRDLVAADDAAPPVILEGAADPVDLFAQRRGRLVQDGLGALLGDLLSQLKLELLNAAGCHEQYSFRTGRRFFMR